MIASFTSSGRTISICLNSLAYSAWEEVRPRIWIRWRCSPSTRPILWPSNVPCISASSSDWGCRQAEELRPRIDQDTPQLSFGTQGLDEATAEGGQNLARLPGCALPDSADGSPGFQRRILGAPLAVNSLA